MTRLSELRTDVEGIIDEYGNRLRFRYYSVTNVGSYFDDAQTLTQSGTDLWTSGLVQPVGGVDSSEDAMLLAQGRIKKSDKKIYVLGTVPTSGVWKVGVGSPVTDEFATIQDGNTAWDVNGGLVYKKVFARFLPNGSLTGE